MQQVVALSKAWELPCPFQPFETQLSQQEQKEMQKKNSVISFLPQPLLPSSSGVLRVKPVLTKPQQLESILGSRCSWTESALCLQKLPGGVARPPGKFTSLLRAHPPWRPSGWLQTEGHVEDRWVCICGLQCVQPAEPEGRVLRGDAGQRSTTQNQVPPAISQNWIPGPQRSSDITTCSNRLVFPGPQ